MDEPQDFAEEMSRSERIRLVLIYGALGAAIVAPMQFWFFPALEEFSESAACRTILGENGLVVMLYGTLVGLPVLFALVALGTLGISGYRIIKTEQFPLAGQKVLRPTRIRRGTRAKVIGWVHIGLVALFFTIPIFAYRVAHAIISDVTQVPINCQSGGRSSNGDRRPSPRIPGESGL